MLWIVRTSIALALLAGAGMLWLGFTYPALAAAACAGCTGMERVSPTLVVEPDMAPAAREALVRTREKAARSVERFFGERAAALDEAVLVACATEACDRRMGGRGARATVLTTPVLVAIRLSPRGLDRTIVAHELAHVAIHERTGPERARTGVFPAWFDEGLAVIVSEDDRYVRGTEATECSDVPLPADPLEWASASGRNPMIYAHAACRVLAWMETNGGRGGLLRALEDRRPLP